MMQNADADDIYRDMGPFRAESHGHALTFYPAGKDRLDALLDVVNGAQSSLKIFYYMFQNDEAGGQLRDALAAAALRGVDVHLLVDRFGTDADNAFFEPIEQAGGRFAAFSPKWSRRYLIRNHQKILIADDTTAMVGGFNVSDTYFAPPEANGWCDLGCKITGPVVDDLRCWYEQLRGWTESPKNQFRAIRRLIREWRPRDGPACLTLGGPTRVPSNWAVMVKKDLAKASRLDLIMAYFSPPRSFRRLIGKIGLRGKARIVLAGKSDNGTTVAAARALYGSLLRRDVKIYEFQPTKLHMKLIVVDDIVYFGSANFDHRSIRLNLELMFRFEDAALAKTIRTLVGHLEQASIEITPQLHSRRRSIFTQLKWLAGWFLVSTVDYTISRSLNIDD